MSELIHLDDFSAGWVPSDDPINGRKNGLLKMDSVELDQNGALRLVGGTTRMLSVFTNTLHSLFSKRINATTYTYSGDTAGEVFRNNTSIESGGSATRAAFVAAFNYVFGFSGNKRFKDTGAAATDLGIIKPSAAPTLATGAAGVLTGDYEYCQINVLVNGAYQAKSARGPIGTLTLSSQIATVTPQNPSTPGSTANEAWIFRRGVNLETWYRIARVTTYGAFSDNMSDSDALELAVTMNDFHLSINSTDTPDAILDVVGPIYGRLLYFTAKQIIPSDINSPDSYDYRTVIGFGSSAGAELFKWAIKVNRNLVLVGTDVDVYSLTGTFVQLPDGFLDISVLPLGVENPPLGIDVTVYGNAVIYMSKIGWVICTPNGETTSMVAPNTDRLYRGETINDYTPPTLDSSGATRYPCRVVKNKLFTVVPTSTKRFEVFDFLRRYWRTCYAGVTPKMLATTESGALIGFDDTDKFIKVYDDISTKVFNDGSNTKQTIDILTTFQDNGKPRNKKDVYTLVIRGYTGSASLGLTVEVAYDGSTSFTALVGAFKGLTETELSWDLSGGTTDPGQIAKCIQIRLTGDVPDCVINDISVSYDERPRSELHLNLQDLGLDSVNKKRVRSIPFIINTNGEDVHFYPVVDGNIGTKSIFNTNKKKVATHYFLTDVFGVNFTGYFVAQSVTPFEFYKVLPADVVQTLPVGKRFDQIGPTELARYGKIKEFELRLLAFNGTSIPYTIYFEDNNKYESTLTIVDSKEGVYNVGLPKGVVGTILRIELGPTSFVFHRTYTRIKVIKTGKDTDEVWVTLESGPIA